MASRYEHDLALPGAAAQAVEPAQDQHPRVRRRAAKREAVEDLFAADRVLNGAAPYPRLAPPLAGPVIPQGQRKLLKLVGFSRGKAASS